MLSYEYIPFEIGIQKSKKTAGKFSKNEDVDIVDKWWQEEQTR